MGQPTRKEGREIQRPPFRRIRGLKGGSLGEKNGGKSLQHGGPQGLYQEGAWDLPASHLNDEKRESKVFAANKSGLR